MGYELCVLELSDTAVLIAYELFLAGTLRHLLRFVAVYSIAESGGGPVVPA